jgi:hypothetical protein
MQSCMKTPGASPAGGGTPSAAAAWLGNLYVQFDPFT